MVEDFDGPSSVWVKSATLSKTFLCELLALVSSNWAQVVFFQIWGIESTFLLISERSQDFLPKVAKEGAKKERKGGATFFSLQLSPSIRRNKQSTGCICSEQRDPHGCRTLLFSSGPWPKKEDWPKKKDRNQRRPGCRRKKASMEDRVSSCLGPYLPT